MKRGSAVFVVSLACMFAIIVFLGILVMPSSNDLPPLCSDAGGLECDETTIRLSNETLSFVVRGESEDINGVSIGGTQQRICEHRELPSTVTTVLATCPYEGEARVDYRVYRKGMSDVTGRLVLPDQTLAGITDSLPAPKDVEQVSFSDTSLLIRTSTTVYLYSHINPAQLHLQSQIDIASLDMEAKGNALYILSEDGLSVYDVSDPVTPFLMGSKSLRGENLAVWNDELSVSGGPRLITFSLEDPLLPIEVSSRELSVDMYQKDKEKVFSTNKNTLLVETNTTSLRVELQSPPTKLISNYVLVDEAFYSIDSGSYIQTGFPLSDIAIDDGTVYTAAGYGDIQRHTSGGEPLTQIVVPGEVYRLDANNGWIAAVSTEGLFMYVV